jgi:hypothetical protein
VESEIQALYIRYFGRPADYQGLDFWVRSLAQGQSINQIKSLFETSPEFTSLYADQRPERIVERAYSFLFGRVPDAGGLDFWSNHLSSGRLSLNTILDTLVNSAVSEDRNTLSKRVESANAFTGALRQASIAFSTTRVQDTGRKWLSQIDATGASQNLAIGQLPVLIPRLNGSEPALIDEDVAGAFRTMVSRLGSNPVLRVFYNLTGSSQTQIPTPLTPQPINDEILGTLRLTFSRIDEIAPSFRLEETTTLQNADIEVHASSGFTNNTVGLTTSRMRAISGSGIAQIYTRVDILPLSGTDLKYVVGHEVLHVFGGEHPFDSSDGDSLGSVSTADTLLSYQQSTLAVQNGYRNIFTPLDEAVIRSIYA